MRLVAVAVVIKVEKKKKKDTIHDACDVFVDEPYKPYDAVDGCMMTAVYGVDPYRTPYR